MRFHDSRYKMAIMLSNFTNSPFQKIAATFVSYKKHCYRYLMLYWIFLIVNNIPNIIFQQKKLVLYTKLNKV